MRVLLIQENGRHDENRKFRECYSLQRAFQELGHQAEVWGLGHANHQTIPNWDEYDIVLNLENYGDEWLPDLSQVEKPLKLLWSIDAHCRGVEAYNKIFNAGKYDYLLHSTRRYVTNEVRHIWFPNAYDPTLIKPLDIPRTIKVGFCGSWANRKPLLEKLRDECGLHLDIWVLGDKMVETINSYHCQFNKNVGDDINYRSFETIACGTLLLTNYNQEYTDLGFIHGENCLMYDESNMAELVRSVQEQGFWFEEQLTSCASRGWQLAQEHTYTHRVKQLLEEI